MTRFRLWLVDHLPTGLLARPAECFLALLCLYSGPLIVTGLSRPKSVEQLLPPVVFNLWGGTLVVGGLGLACGLTSYRRTPVGNWAITRVPCYRLGLRLLGISALLYAVAQLSFGRLDAIPAASITLAFAATCGVRLLTLGHPK